MQQGYRVVEFENGNVELYLDTIEPANIIKEAIDKIMARQEVTKLAELFSAVHTVDEIYYQYNKSGRFTTDMLIRLALVERDAKILSRRYEILENSNTEGISDNDIYNYDTFCTMLSSFLNIRVSQLRVNVDIQENPESAQHSSDSFMVLLKDTISLWNKILHKSDKMKSDIDGMSTKLESAKGLQKIAQLTKEKELSRMKDKYTAAIEKERVILRDFHSLIDTVQQIVEQTNDQSLPTLIYWCDHNGEHCITTNESILDRVM